MRLDQRAILDSPRWWAQLLWYYPALFNIALICAGSMAMLARRQIRELVLAWARDDAPSEARFFLGAHALLAVLFYGLSVAGFQQGFAAGPGADLWFLAWLTCGLLTGAAWCCALARPRFWIAFLRNSARAILWGLALGCILWEGGEILTGSLFQFGRQPTLLVVAAMLRVLGYHPFITVEPALVGTQAFSVQLSAGCLGYEGIALVLVFSSAFLFALRKELAFPRSFLLVVLAVAASWWMNALRVVALVLLGTYRGEYAIEGFHSVAGWFYFAAIAAGVVLLSQQRWFSNVQRENPSVAPTENPAAPYLLPLLVLVATAMATRVFTGAFDALYPLRVAFVGAILFMYRRRVTELGWRGSAWAAVPGALVFVGWMALEPAPAPSPIALGLASLPRWAAVAWLVFRVLGSILTVPLAEELAFRGYLARKLTATDFETVPDGRFSRFALVASSVMFGAMHGRFLAGTLAGVAFAVTLGRRGRLADAVVAHGTANALIALYVLSTHDWSVWD